MPLKCKNPGIYFGLDEQEYHDDISLGSTDMKRLVNSPPDYWFNSSHNPLRLDDSEKQNPSQMFGTACHKMVLEGTDAFHANYGVCEYPGNIKAGKEERAVLEIAGKRPLSRKDWDRIHMAGAAIRANPYLAEAFSGGVGSEVSIFWRDAKGIPKKARIDRLKLRANVDLKTINPVLDLEFPAACMRQIASYRYDCQALHYSDARAQLSALIAAGAVHGDHDAAALKAAAAEKTWASVIVFLKSTDAPLTWGTTISLGSPILDAARAALDRADANYLAFVEKFGFETPWLTQHPLEELAIEEMPAWFGR